MKKVRIIPDTANIHQCMHLEATLILAIADHLLGKAVVDKINKKIKANVEFENLEV